MTEAFDYYIISERPHTVQGTDDRAVALRMAMLDGWYVIETNTARELWKDESYEISEYKE